METFRAGSSLVLVTCTCDVSAGAEIGCLWDSLADCADTHRCYVGVLFSAGVMPWPHRPAFHVCPVKGVPSLPLLVRIPPPVRTLCSSRHPLLLALVPVVPAHLPSFTPGAEVRRPHPLPSSTGALQQGAEHSGARWPCVSSSGIRARLCFPVHSDLPEARAVPVKGQPRPPATSLWTRAGSPRQLSTGPAGPAASSSGTRRLFLVPEGWPFWAFVSLDPASSPSPLRPNALLLLWRRVSGPLPTPPHPWTVLRQPQRGLSVRCQAGGQPADRTPDHLHGLLLLWEVRVCWDFFTPQKDDRGQRSENFYFKKPLIWTQKIHRKE
ncbi:uncharacterized protein LOC122242040 isoform X1 [Panthera tigris]|uniref:uncharacterized protein LOC122242040 isoform X1 n=1 Tax=Panthera tigris TaxID=9694 RepID=UPI001C6F8CD6|nr:uncharacterized protein LOC122242040 isoform X1 [Panthera tigris]XP_042855026.1 uncharacterized protein LOC122242040 isoform X1 [Panthera tigris]XP_042855027.1 uncharacterized protein LOC122242040 isoform X1 [Panthera tigris]XP_042855028.1 uncharacterized protein LOC122242040 isoform X1 [Panthera tigris]